MCSLFHDIVLYLTDCSLIDVDNSAGLSTVYDLVANITHTSNAGTARENTVWKTYVHTQASKEQEERWFLIQDLIVENISREVVPLGESYIQVSRL